MNDSVDLARDIAKPPEGYYEGVKESKMTELAQWIKEADNVI